MAVTQPTPMEAVCHTLDICNRNVGDDLVSDRIKTNCPPKTYSWLFVRTVEHHFRTIPGGQPTEPARLIRFQPTNKQAALNILCIIFQRTSIETLNINRVILGLLGSPEPRDKTAAKSAYWQNYTITVYVSMGTSFSVDIQAEQGAATQRIAGVCTLL